MRTITCDGCGKALTEEQAPHVMEVHEHFYVPLGKPIMPSDYIMKSIPRIMMIKTEPDTTTVQADFCMLCMLKAVRDHLTHIIHEEEQEAK